MDTGEYAFFDHTADMGISLRAPTRAMLVARAGEALYAAIGELVGGERGSPWRVELSGDDAAMLLRDYLTELLVLFESSLAIVVDPRVEEYSDARLVVRGDAFAIDEARTVFLREVKAITYHGLELRESENGVEATVIVDI